MTLAFGAHSFRIFMVGDSHVCSKIYPERVGDILVDAEPAIDFSYWGKIGASLLTYNESAEMMKRIYDAEPDVLIVHLGTNDSYSHQFNRGQFLEHLTTFYDNVEHHLPDCAIVFVTPFYNRLKDHTVNHNTRVCADEYLEFASSHRNAYVVDNNADYGMVFLDGGEELIRHDGVHLTVKGYEELGDQVGEGLIETDGIWTLEEEPYLYEEN